MPRLIAVILAGALLAGCGVRSTVQQFAMRVRDQSGVAYAAADTARHPDLPKKGEVGGDVPGLAAPSSAAPPAAEQLASAASQNSAGPTPAGATTTR